ncbi:MAG: HEAT repeat domain-containing protein [Desulfobacteraceae bacterium]
MATDKTPEHEAPPKSILDFVGALMRALNTARLYATEHELFKKNIGEVHTALGNALADSGSLFLGCAKDTLFLEGTFYQAEDTHFQKFLEFFHALRISHVLFDKGIASKELESFVALLAGARPGQGDEISEALARENITQVKLGFMDYSVFSTIQMAATQLAQSSDEEAVWRLLILQPEAAGAVSLDPESVERLTRLSEDGEELNRLILQMDSDMKEGKETASHSQRGMLLGNFIQNLGDTLAGIAPEKRDQFALHVGNILESLEPKLKIQILGSLAPDDTGEKEGDFLQEIFQDISDSELVHLMADALKDSGANSQCFNNLFQRTLGRYREPGLLLPLIRQEMYKATMEFQPGRLSHWQHLEELFLQQQESEQLNAQYRKEIESLAASLQIKTPMVEDEEMARLLSTMAPEPLIAAKARVIIDLLRHPHPPQLQAFIPPLLESLGDMMRNLMSRERFKAVGTLLRAVFIILTNLPDEALARKTMNAQLSAEEVGDLIKDLMKDCKTYESKETAAIDAICQVFPEKTSGFLIDRFIDLQTDDGPQAQWLSTTLATLGPRLSRILSQRLQDAPARTLLRLLDLVALSSDKQLGSAVEPLLDHQSQEIRIRAISTLGHLRADRSVPRLEQILFQKSLLKSKKTKAFQMAAAQAMARIGTKEAQAALQRVAREGSGDLQTRCEKLIQSSGREHDSTKQQ